MFLGSLPSLYPALFGGGRSPPAAGQRFSLDLNSPTPPGAGETAAQSSPREAAADAADAAADDADVDTESDHDSLDTADEGDEEEEEANDEDDAVSRRPGQRMLLLAGLLSAAAFGMGLLLLLASSGSSNGAYHSSNSSYYYNYQHYSHPYGLSISVPDIAVPPGASPAAPRRLVSYDSVAGDRAVPAAAAALKTATTAGHGLHQQRQQQPKASRCSRLYHSRPQELEVASSGEPQVRAELSPLHACIACAPHPPLCPLRITAADLAVTPPTSPAQAATPARSCSIHTPKTSWWLAAPEATRKSNSVLPAVQASHQHRANATPGLWLLLQPASGSAGSACAAAALAANQAAWESAMTAFGARLLARHGEAPTAAAPATATCKPSPLQDWSSLLLWFSSGSAASPRPAAPSCSLNVSQPWQLMPIMRQPTPPAATSQPPRWWYSCTAQEASQAFSCVRHAWNEWPSAAISHGSNRNSTSELWLLLARQATASNSMCPVQTCAAQRSSLVLLLLPSDSRATCKQLARAAVAAQAAACDAPMLHALAAASAAAPAPPSVLHTPVLPPRAAATLATAPSFIVAQPTRAVPPLYRPPLPCLAVRARGGAKASRIAAATAAATATPALRHRVLQQLPADTTDLALSRPWLLLLPYSHSSCTQMRGQGSSGATSTGGAAQLWTARSRDEAVAAPSPPPMTCDASSKQQAWGAAAAAAGTSKAAAVVVLREPSHVPPHARSNGHGAAGAKPQSCALWEAHFHVPATNNRPHRKLLAELQDYERHQHQRTQPATCSSGSSGSFLLVHKLLPITAGGAAAAAAGHQQQPAATSPHVMRQLLGMSWDLYEDEDDYADLNDIPRLTDDVTDDGDGGAADSARLGLRHSTFQQLYQEAGMPCGIPQAAPAAPAALTALATASALKVAPPPAASPVVLPAFAMAAQRVVRAPPPPPPRCSNNDTLAAAVAASTRLAAAASEVNSFLARVNRQLVPYSSASAPAKAGTQHPRCINSSSSPLAMLLAASQQAATAARDTAAAVVPAAQWVASFISLPMLPARDEPQPAERCSNAFEAVIRASATDAAAWRAGSNASETAGRVASTGCASRTPLWTGQVL
jgi:hypothetical protein